MKLPQLSLRELFLLVVIAAMGCGWWVDRTRLAESLRLFNRTGYRLHDNGGVVGEPTPGRDLYVQGNP